MSGFDLADEPLNAKQIVDQAIGAVWKTEGNTPKASLYVAMIREIGKKGDASRFKKADRGLFAADRQRR